MPRESLDAVTARIDAARLTGRICSLVARAARARVVRINRLVEARCLDAHTACRMALEAEALAFAFPPLPEEMVP